MKKDYYYILGIEKGASVDEIKQAYRKLSKKFHPDLNSGDKYFEERFKDIQEAYEYLTKNTSNGSSEKGESFESSNEIVKSNAKYAAASGITDDGFAYTFIIGGLALLMILCSFYAIYDLFIR
jgi:curved DNA-binding protein CbpA